MTDRQRSGSGDLGRSDSDLGADINSAGSAGSGLGSSDLDARDFDTAATSGSLGLGAGTGLGSTDLGGSDFDTVGTTTGDVSLGSGRDFGSGSVTGSTLGTTDVTGSADVSTMLPPTSGIAGTNTTTTGGTDVGASSESESSSGGGLPGLAMGALAGAAIGAAASALFGGGKEGSSHAEHEIEVDVPVSTAYNQWTQFEEFPQFMQGVEQVQQLDDKRLHWRAEIGFKDKEWDAEIVDQVPDQRVSWRSTSGAPNGGTVSFQPIGANRTRVTLRLDYDPEGLIENVGDTIGVVSQRIQGDLGRFKQFIESRGTETGGWRGEIHRGQ